MFTQDIRNTDTNRGTDNIVYGNAETTNVAVFGIKVESYENDQDIQDEDYSADDSLPLADTEHRAKRGTVQEVMKVKMLPLTRGEVSLLITLVKGHSELRRRGTNASTNAEKQEAWKKICVQFNANVKSGPRKPEQLRLKWENLKKAARKRMASRINSFRTGGPLHYLPPDDALDQVATILGAADGFSAPCPEDGAEAEGDCAPTEHPAVVEGVASGHNDQCNGSSTPVVKTAKLKRSLHIEYAKSRTARNLAIADYFNTKRQKVELEIEKMKYEIEKLKNK